MGIKYQNKNTNGISGIVNSYLEIIRGVDECRVLGEEEVG